MKKVFLIILVGCTCAVLKAQQGLHMGFKVAPQSTLMINKDNSDNAHYRDVPVWRFACGLSFDYHFKPTVGVGLDFILSNQGAKFEEYKTSTDTLTGTNSLRLQYFKLPVLLHFNTNPEKPVMFVGQFGPQFGFLTKAELEVEEHNTMIGAGYPGIAVPGAYNVKDVYKSVNIGAVLGFGLGTTFGTDFLAMTVQLRFDFAFTDAEDKPAVTDDVDAVSKAWYYYFYPSDMDMEAANRPTTFNTTGGIELGLKYIFNKKK